MLAYTVRQGGGQLAGKPGERGVLATGFQRSNPVEAAP